MALEIPLINFEVNINLTWSKSCVIICTNLPNQNSTFGITEAKIYVLVSLSTQDNTKLLSQLKSNFKRTINWNKYLSKP